MSKIGWKFPPTGGGQESGWRDPGLAHFRGSPIRSLARETIQNSLDARLDASKPVHVSFELHTFDQRDVPGINQLRAAIAACLREGDEERTALDEMQQAQGLSEERTLPFLRVGDWNTTGLDSAKWQALVKSQGVSHHGGGVLTSGGSHGIGKYAPYAVSPLRTVFYWTRASEYGSEVERFQGRSLLMSHDSTRQDQHGRTQAVGYYGFVDQCRELDRRDVPAAISAIEHNQTRECGTSLWIAGFRPKPGWRAELARTVIESFYPAIARGDLTVTLDDDGPLAQAQAGGELPDELEISAQNLSKWFEHLLWQETDVGDDEEEMTPLALARECWGLMQGETEPAIVNDDDFGECRVWSRFVPGLPQQIAVVRGTGMVITTQQEGLRLRGIEDFAAVCRFDSPNGNELLRRMENPLHDQFKWDWLPEEERAAGRRNLRRMLAKIRKAVRTAAPERPEGEAVELAELAELLPDLKSSNEGLGDLIGTGAEGETLIIRRPPRRKRQDPKPAPIGYVALAEQRIEPVGVNRVEIAFTPQENAIAKIELAEVGDGEVIQQEVSAYWPQGGQILLDDFELRAGERVRFQFIGDEDVTQRAWRATARKLEVT